MTVDELINVLSIYNKHDEVTINNQPITQLEVKSNGYIFIIQSKNKQL